MFSKMTTKTVLFLLWCLCCVSGAFSSDNVTLEEPTGNIMGFNWKLPQDGGGGDSQCERDIRKMYTNLNNMTLWAFQMWESTAGETNGWLDGSVFQFGNFDECLGGADDPGMERQYCLATVTIEEPPGHSPIVKYMKNFPANSSVYDVLFYSGDIVYTKRNKLRWGICSPASCSPQELEVLMQRHVDSQLEQIMKPDDDPALLDSYRKIITIPEKSCQNTNIPKPLSGGAIAFIVFFTICCMVVLGVTAYHWITIHRMTNAKFYMSPVKEFPESLKAFSLISHLDELTIGAMGGDNKGVDVMWGMKVISICFFIMGHRCGTRLAAPVLNRNEIERQYLDSINAIIYHGDLVVDSFLVFSGMLSFVVNMKIFEYGSRNYPLMIFNRYIRIAPAYALVVWFTGHVLPSTGTGPLWPTELDAEGTYCRENWWKNILMLSNYMSVDRLCMVHSWYIPCDFHLFLLSLPICTLFAKKSLVKISLSVTVLLLIGSMIIPAVITYKTNLPGTLLFVDDFLTNPRGYEFFQKIYITTHTRAGPYLIGLLTGSVLLKYYVPGRKILSTKVSIIVALLSIACLSCMMSSGILFYQPNHQYNPIEAALYAAFQRTLWAASLCVFIMCCIFGNVPLLTTFLGWPGWVPFGKLTYGAYLVHMGLQIRSAATSRNPYYVDNITLVGQAFGDLFISFGISFLMYVTVEVPPKKLFRMFISNMIKKNSAKTTDGANMAMNDVETAAAKDSEDKERIMVDFNITASGERHLNNSDGETYTKLDSRIKNNIK